MVFTRFRGSVSTVCWKATLVFSQLKKKIFQFQFTRYFVQSTVLDISLTASSWIGMLLCCPWQRADLQHLPSPWLNNEPNDGWSFAAADWQPKEGVNKAVAARAIVGERTFRTVKKDAIQQYNALLTETTHVLHAVNRANTSHEQNKQLIIS